MVDLLFDDLAMTSVKPGIDILVTSGRSAIGKAFGTYVADPLASVIAAAHPRLASVTGNGRAFRALPDDGLVAVELAGAAGDGTGDDRPAIAAAHAYVAATALRGVRFDSPRYRLTPVPVSETNYGLGPQPCYVVPVDANTIDGRGATFDITSGRGFVCGWWYAGPVVDLPLAADVAAGARTVQLEAGLGAQLAVGDDVIWMLGDLPFDPAETYNWGLATVTEIAGDTVTLNRPIPTPFTLTAGLVNRHLRKALFARDLAIRDLTIVSDAAEVGLLVLGGERLTLERIGSRNLAAATIGLHYVDGATLTDCFASETNPTLASSGAAFAFAECRNIQLIRPRAEGVLSMIRAEAGAELQVVGAQFDNTIVDANGAPKGRDVRIFQAASRSRISLHDTTITGYGDYVLASTSIGQPDHDGHVALSGRTRLIHDTDPYQLPIQSMSGMLDMTIGDVRELYNLDKLRVYRRRFNLRDGQYRTVLGPMGLLIRARVYVSPNVTIGAGQQLASFSIGRQGNNGSNVAQGALGGLQAGVDVQLSIFGGAIAGLQWVDRLKPLQLNCSTTSGAGLDAGTEFVEIEAWMAEPEGVARPVSEADWRGEGSEREIREVRFAGYDLPAIAAGASLSVELAIPDMAAGDFIDSVELATGLSGLAIRSAEALAGKVRVVFENPTAAGIDKAPTDIGIAFSKPALGA